jgi:hypothetical protein
MREVHMRWFNRKLGDAVLLAAMTATACDRGASGPDGVFEPSPAATVTAGPVGFLPGWSSLNQEDLKPLLESEKARIAAEQERSKPLYDSLKAVWEQSLKQGKKTGSPLLMCDPLQYTADTKIIGPEGGDMSIGPHKLSIPRGALKQYTVVTGELPVSLNVEVKLSPHGLRFLKPPTLMLSYKHCLVPNESWYRLVYVDDNGQILEWPFSYDAKRVGELFGWIWHFSTYAVFRGYTAAGG